MRFSVKHDGHVHTFDRCYFLFRRICVSLHFIRLGGGRCEALTVDAVCRDACIMECFFSDFNHGLRAANKHFVHASCWQERVDDRFNLLSINAALQEINFLSLLRQDMNHRETGRKAIFQVLQGFVEHHA